MLSVTAPRFAPTTRAALWILLSGSCAVMMNVLIRVAAQSMHPFEVAFFRCLFGLLLVLPWVVKGGPSLLRSRNVGFYLLRAAVGLVSMATWFYGITVVPLATCDRRQLHRASIRHNRGRAGTAGGRQTAPLERGGDRVRRRARDHAAGQRAARREPPDPAVVGGERGDEQYYGQVPRTHRAAGQNRRYVHDLPDALSLVPALFVWQWPNPATLGALFGLGCLGTIAHFSVARALAAADASACAPFEFARLPFAALVGFLWFGEVTDVWTWVGAGIIAASSIYVAHREARLARLARRGEGRAPRQSRR